MLKAPGLTKIRRQICNPPLDLHTNVCNHMCKKEGGYANKFSNR